MLVKCQVTTNTLTDTLVDMSIKAPYKIDDPQKVAFIHWLADFDPLCQFLFLYICSQLVVPKIMTDDIKTHNLIIF